MQHGMYYWAFLLVALALIAIAGTATGELPVTWNQTYGGPVAGEAAYAIVADPGGAGFFLVGETASFGRGKSDAWVVRLTPEGNEEWNITYGGEEADTARSVIETGDGNLLIAGNLTFATNETRLDTDAWIVKIDPSGNEIWNRTYGGPDVNASANAVIATDDGGYIFVGSIAPWGGNESDAWVGRLNESGDKVWERRWGGAGNDTANAVTRIPDGDFVFAGRTASSGAGMADAWVVRLNASGDEVWNRTFGGPDDDDARAVINTTDGNLLIAGTFTERPDNETVDTDALLIKLTPAGDIIWNWIYGDVGVDESASVVIETADGGYVFAGETGFPGVDDTDAWLVGTDAEGSVAWSRTFGGINPGDRATSVLQLAKDEYIFTGAFNATERGGAVNADAWAVRLGVVTEPTPAPTPTPTAVPIKPPKAPVVHQKPAITVAPTAAITTPPVATATPKPMITRAPTEEISAPQSSTQTQKSAKKPTVTETPKPILTERSTEKPTEEPTKRPDDGDNNDDLDDSRDSSSFSGMVWYDLNANGIRDPGEPGIPGINVRLIGRRTMIDHAVTDFDGSYRFTITPPTGGYAGIEFLIPDGYSCTIPGLDNDAIQTSETVAFAEAGAGGDSLNAGLVGKYQTGTPAAAYGWIRGTTWSDDNQNGVRDETYGITGVEVRLLDADGAVVAARTGYHDYYTSMYLFGPLLPGEYSLMFTPPEDYIFTDPGKDSHADPVTGMTNPFMVGGGDTVVRDAGLIPSPTTGSGSAPEPTWTVPPADADGPDEPEGETIDGDRENKDGEEQEATNDETADDERKVDAEGADDEKQRGETVTDEPQDSDDAGDKQKKTETEENDS